jgi:hypothetical protein
MTDAVLFKQGIINGQNGAAWVAKNNLHPMIGQNLKHCFSAIGVGKKRGIERRVKHTKNQRVSLGE